MRKLFKKWGEAMLAALCVLAIVFAALYTRQDDLRRMAARSAGSRRDGIFAGQVLMIGVCPWAKGI